MDQYHLPKPEELFAKLAGGRDSPYTCLSTDTSGGKLSEICYKHTQRVVPVYTVTFWGGLCSSAVPTCNGHCAARNCRNNLLHWRCPCDREQWGVRHSSQEGGVLIREWEGGVLRTPHWQWWAAHPGQQSGSYYPGTPARERTGTLGLLHYYGNFFRPSYLATILEQPTPSWTWMKECTGEEAKKVLVTAQHWHTMTHHC